MDDFNNSKTPCGAKGFDMSGFYRLKKRKLVIGGGLMISWSWNHFFFFAWRKKCVYLWGWIRVATLSLFKNTSRFFFWKGLIIIFLVYVELLVSWLLLGESGRSFHLSLPFGCGSISDRSHVRASLHDFTRVLFLRFNSHEVYSAINGTF